MLILVISLDTLMRKEGSFLKIHIVQKGDTLWEIAKKYNVDFEALKQANSHLASPDMIMPGMKIRIPSQSKKIATKDKKQVAPKKEIKTEPPVKKQPPKSEKSIELPKMPTFPLEQEELSPLKGKQYKEEKKVKEYPISILPELPETKKEYKKPKSSPKQEVKPEMMPPKETYSYPPEEQPIFMPPPYPSYPQQQMMPIATYPCQGMMPMPPMGCGCGGMQPPMPPMGCGCGGMHPPMPYGYHQMPQAMYPFEQPDMQPNMMAQPFGHEGFQNQLSNEPQMYPTSRAPESQPETSEPHLQMYPEPPLGMRDQKQEMSPTPNETSFTEDNKQENENFE